ncbi:MAG: multicopper oxidase domain-containing protein [Bryobacteraceae bacterium]
MLGAILGGTALIRPKSVPGSELFSPRISQALASPQVAPFISPLAIPPVLSPASSDESTDYYELTMQEAKVEIVPGTLTTIWGYNGLYPGPTIKVQSGRRAVVRQVNNLPESMSIHLHGGHVSPELVDIRTISFPGSFRTDYPNNQIPATLWYHDHAVDATGRHVYMGLAGFYIMTDELEEGLSLPGGANDIALVIQDRLFNADSSLNYALNDDTLVEGVLGDRLLVNGVIQPYLEVGKRKMRFRMLNGSNSRSYSLALSSGEPLIQIGSDGGLLPRPVRRLSINLAPGERIDVIIDFSKYALGARIVLKNGFSPEPNLAEVMEFRIGRDEPDDSRVPGTLRPVERIPEHTAVVTRSFVLADEVINGRKLWTIDRKLYDPARMDASLTLNDVEIWEFINNSYSTHPMHIHDIQFQILDINGRKPLAGDDGWKDVFPVPALGRLRVIGKFVNLTGTYVFHCHKLEHEDHAMMGQFEVRAPKTPEV